MIHKVNPYDGFDPSPYRLDLQGWHSTDPVFEELIAAVRPRTIFEVGTWKGASAVHMASLVKKYGLDTTIVCVDTWLGAPEFWTNHLPDMDRYAALNLKNGYPDVYRQFLANVVLCGAQDVIVPFPQTSLGAAEYFRHARMRADLVYVDGAHDEKSVADDLGAYDPLCDGVIFGDDYANLAFPGVRRAVDARYGGRARRRGVFWVVPKHGPSP